MVTGGGGVPSLKDPWDAASHLGNVGFSFSQSVRQHTWHLLLALRGAELCP